MDLYGHPFSSYTWKALIALYANVTPFAFRMVDPDHPEHTATVAAASPQGRFPLLVDDGAEIFEATAIIEHLDIRHPGDRPLIPRDSGEAVHERMIDRVFDNYVMSPMQEIVAAHIRAPDMPDPQIVGRARDMLGKSYAWLDAWFARASRPGPIALVECAAAPSLFYADWVYPIPMEHDRLRQWRAHLLALPPVKRCIDEARPYRHFFPTGAPDRD